MKTVVIIGIIVVFGLGVLVFGGGSDDTQSISQPVRIDDTRLRSSDYPFLSENQFDDAKDAKRDCDNKLPSAVKRLCYQGLEELIDIRQLQNVIYQLSESKDYNQCHNLWENLKCLEEIAIKTNDPTACDEILNSPVSNIETLELRHENCLNSLR